MVNLINRHNRRHLAPLLDAMHADRKRVFVDLLKWDVPHDSRLERDQFDDDYAEYLIVQDKQTAEHLASVRLLRTERPHILGDIFPMLSTDPVPRGPEYREITRLCLAPGIGRAARIACRNQLARSLVEYALMTGVKAFTGVAEMGWFSQILSAGWSCRPLGMPTQIDGRTLCALRIDISTATLTSFTPPWQCEATTMRIVELPTHLAA